MRLNKKQMNAIAECAARQSDGQRDFMNSILFDGKTLIATNAHVLVIVTDERADEPTLADRRAIERADWLSVAKMLGSAGNQYAEFSIASEGVAVSLSGKTPEAPRQQLTLSGSPLVGQWYAFDNLERALPTGEEPPKKFFFYNPKLMLKAADLFLAFKGAKEFYGFGGDVRFNSFGALGFDSEVNSFGQSLRVRTAVMPMRIK